MRLQRTDADAARNALGHALSHAGLSGALDAAIAARRLRQAIEEARRHNNPRLTVSGLDAIAEFIARHEPETAYLLDLVSQRLDPIGSVLGAEALARMDSQRRSELEAEPLGLSREHAIATAFAALERHYPSG
jgi:hypothetical protein